MCIIHFSICFFIQMYVLSLKRREQRIQTNIGRFIRKIREHNFIQGIVKILQKIFEVLCGSFTDEVLRMEVLPPEQGQEVLRIIGTNVPRQNFGRVLKQTLLRKQGLAVKLDSKIFRHSKMLTNYTRSNFWEFTLGILRNLEHPVWLTLYNNNTDVNE